MLYDNLNHLLFRFASASVMGQFVGSFLSSRYGILVPECDQSQQSNFQQAALSFPIIATFNGRETRLLVPGQGGDDSAFSARTFAVASVAHLSKFRGMAREIGDL